MTKQIEVIKAQGNIRRRNGKIEVAQRRVAAYCRVSTDSEDQKGSYESQVQYYRDYISKNPDWQFVDIYADEAITGTQVEKRQDFQRLITDCLNGEIDYIVTKAIARFARNTLDTLKYVRLLKDKQIGVYFEEENIDTLTMDGELLLTILSSVAQQEVENISAHVKKGLKMKMQRGELVGGPRCLGYNFDWESREITINPEEAKIVRYIFDRYLEGIGGRVIARELEEQGIPSPRGNTSWADTTVLGIIKNEKYKGDVLQGKTFTVDPISKRRLDNYGEEDQYYIKGNHTPIVTEEEFEIMKKHAKDLTEEEHNLVFRSFKMAEEEELKENVQNSNHSIMLTADEIDELADLAMRTPGMSHLLRSKLFVGTQAIKENPLERMLKMIMLQSKL